MIFIIIKFIKIKLHSFWVKIRLHNHKTCRMNGKMTPVANHFQAVLIGASYLSIIPATPRIYPFFFFTRMSKSKSGPLLVFLMRVFYCRKLVMQVLMRYAIASGFNITAAVRGRRGGKKKKKRRRKGANLNVATYESRRSRAIIPNIWRAGAAAAASRTAQH